MLSRYVYESLCDAYEALNRALFDDTLPTNIIITLQPRRNAYGFFSSCSWSPVAGGAGEEHQITMNPSHFTRPRIDSLSTLAHEMCHLWQECFGEHKPQRAYHNREWAEAMTERGLVPSVTGKPGGAQTGKNVSHYIHEQGLFAAKAPDILAGAPYLFAYHYTPQTIETRTPEKKWKYACPLHPDTKAWAHAGTPLVCGECGTELERPMLQLPLLTEP